MKRSVASLYGSTDGAVAPTVALSLIALLAVGGIAFDYARMASLDTELQNAADQAALAGASQLDRKAGACARAAAAAVSLVANQARFGNDTGQLAITVDSEPTCDATGKIKFWQNATKTTAATSDATARFIEVTVNSRTAYFSLTPIVGVFNSGALAATALAGMGSAICKVPPLMMCNPNPGTPMNLDNYPWDTTPGWKGVGLKLFMGGSGSWGPGAFGWLDVGAVNNGTPDQNLAIGMNFPNTNCVADAGLEVDTGVSASVLDALNVRFDIFQNGWARNTCYPHANCSPAWNTVKDLVRSAAPSATSCGIHNNEWHLPSDTNQYIAQNAAGDDPTVTHMGYPMDICHFPSGGSCGTTNQRFGNGNWRRDIYFATNHNSLTSGGTNWQTATGLSANATRYDVYRWEQNITGVGNTAGVRPVVTNGGDTQYGQPICKPPGVAAGSTQPDRRVVAAAVADNCASLTGGSTAVSAGAWAEMFLVQPSVARSAAGVSANEIYVEIIGRANPTGSGATAQIVQRDVPYLVE